MTVPYKLNDAVLLSREREGIIRYVGNVHFSKGIWCGIELIGGALGTNDGIIRRRRYFTCPRNRGLFCKIGKVRRKFRTRDHSATSRQKRKASLEQRLYHKSLCQQAVESELQLKSMTAGPSSKRDRYVINQRNVHKRRSQTTPGSNAKVNWLYERIDSFTRKQNDNRSKAKAFKPGPRDIGRVSSSSWKPIKYKETDTNNTSWMSERLHSPSTSKLKRIRSKSANTNKVYKAGPRDIGRHSGKSWTPIKLSKAEKAKLNEGSSSFLAENRRSKSVATKKKKKDSDKHLRAKQKNVAKGSGSSWTPIKLSKEEKAKLSAGRFLDDRIKGKGKRKRAKSAQCQPRTVGYKAKKQSNNKLGSANRKAKKEKSKKFKIAVNEKFVDPTKLTKSKAKNKELMTGGKRVRKKGGKNSKKRKTRKKTKEYKPYKPGPRDIGRNKNWKPKTLPNKSNKFKNSKKKKLKGSKRVKKDVIKEKSMNQSTFDSFRRTNKRNKKYDNGNGNDMEQRASVRVQLNTQNKAKKSKYIKPKSGNTKEKKRKSAQYPTGSTKKKTKKNSSKYNEYIQNSEIVSNAKYAPYNAVKYMAANAQRASAYKTANYEEFTTYNSEDNTNENTEKRHASAANESEADLDLDDDYEQEPEANDMDIFDIGEDVHGKGHSNDMQSANKAPTEHVYELFGIEIDDHDGDEKADAWTPNVSQPTTPVTPTTPVLEYGGFSDDENDNGLRSGSISPSGHAHIYEGNMSPPEHDNLFDLFDIQQQEQQSYYNKPLPTPPNKPLPKGPNKKVRIKGIDRYVGKWIVSFKGMKQRNKKKNKNKYRQYMFTTFTYSIYKDGSVQIQPKSSFGWNGLANVTFDASHQRFEIHANSKNQSNEYEYILINRNGTLHIEHFNPSHNYKTPIIGTGIKS